MLSALRRALGDASHSDGGSGSNSSTSGQLGLSPRQSGAAVMVAVLGSRGGVGTTTLAVNLAATLACEPGNGVALVDLDLALGDADIALEVNGIENISIADLARNIERLDMNFLRRALVKHEATGLAILRHPLEIMEMGVIHEGHVERILNLLKISYSHLVLDLSKSLLPTDLMAMRMSDVILLTAQLELSSLRNVVRLIHCMGSEDNLAEKVRVVINRVGSDSVEEGISMKKAEEVIGKPIFWQIPNDPKSLIAARIAGEPLIRHNPKSRIHQAIVGLAQSLAGKPAGHAPDLKTKASWSFFGRK